MSDNLRTTMAKITLLAGGAILGAILDYWIEETLDQRASQRSMHDKHRYAQGLPQQPPGQRAIYEIHPEKEEQYD